MIRIANVNNAWSRSGLYVILVAAAGATGYWQGVSNRKTITVEHTAQTLIEYRDRIVVHEKIIHPDGTIEEKDTTREISEDTNHSESDREVTSTPVLPDYSLGIRYGSTYSDLLRNSLSPNPNSLELNIGRRILGPLWVEVGAGLERVTLGVRYEF